jgi:hypothetical protein
MSRGREARSGIDRPYSDESSSSSGDGCNLRWIVEGDVCGDRSVESRAGEGPATEDG